VLIDAVGNQSTEQ